MDDWGHWDHYVSYFDPRSGIGCRERCLGLRTAEAIADSKRQLGFWRVKIEHKRYARHKERHARVVGI